MLCAKKQPDALSRLRRVVINMESFALRLNGVAGATNRSYCVSLRAREYYQFTL